MDTLREKGIKNYSHRARPVSFVKQKRNFCEGNCRLLNFYLFSQITESDFNYFDFILGMDDENIFHLERMKPVDCKAKIRLLGDFDPQGEKIIRDPYYVSINLSCGISGKNIQNRTTISEKNFVFEHS